MGQRFSKVGGDPLRHPSVYSPAPIIAVQCICVQNSWVMYLPETPPKNNSLRLPGYAGCVLAEGMFDLFQFFQANESVGWSHYVLNVYFFWYFF